MPAAGTRTSSSRIVVSGSLRWPPPVLRWAVAVRSRSRPRRRRLRRLPSPSPSCRRPGRGPGLPVLALVAVLWFWSCWSLVLVRLLVLLAVLASGCGALAAGRGSGSGRCWSRSCWRGPGSALVLVLARGPGRAAGRGRSWSRVAVLLAARGLCSGRLLLLGLPGALSWRLARALRPASRLLLGPSPGARSGSGPAPGRVLRASARGPVLRGLSWGAFSWPPLWRALIASTSWAFFMEPAPEMPIPPAIDLRSASSMELSPPPRFLPAAAGAPSGAAVVDSMVSVT